MNQTAREWVDPLTQEDREIIALAPATVLARSWCILNTWSWPEGFEPPPPDPDEKLANILCSTGSSHIFEQLGGEYPRRSALMWAIMDKVGERLISQEWNVWHSKNWTQDEWERWWDGGRSFEMTQELLAARAGHE